MLHYTICIYLQYILSFFCEYTAVKCITMYYENVFKVAKVIAFVLLTKVAFANS